MSQPNLFVAEQNLLDTLNRIANNQAVYSVLLVRLSKLKPKNRHPSFIKVIAKLFDNLVGSAEGMMYILSNGDFAILGRNITPDIVADAIEKLRNGLASDPILFNNNISEFAHLYLFPDEFADFYAHIQKLTEDTSLSKFSDLKYPIDASQMDDIMAHMEAINIAEIVKHQSIIRFENSNKFNLLFKEFFVAVKDLSALYDKNLDLTANKWLFLYLTQALDKKTIASFQAAELKNWPKQVSLNLHLSTIFTPEFDLLAAGSLPGAPQIIAEVQMMDIWNNIDSYFEAKDRLHSQGNQILIDSLLPETLPLIDIQRLEPDWIKIFWNPMMEFDINNGNLSEIINSFGSDRIILAKCTNDKAVRWGVAYGIRNFQGPYIDSLESAIIRSQCPAAKQCDSISCLKRRKRICGLERRQCLHLESLEKVLGQENGN